MSVDLQKVVDLLNATLNPSQSKQAGDALQAEETQPGFSLALLHIVANESYPLNTRLASALCFKNFVRRNWTTENGDHRLPAIEVTTIKSELIGLMVKVPPTIQAQLGDAISVIADSDFWERWDTLVDDLVSRLTPDNAVVNNGVLQVAHSIFKRWEPLQRSDELYTEINHVLTRFSVPLLQLWQNTDQAVEANKDNKEALKAYFVTLELVTQLIYDLSTHDMPPQFEESLGAVAGLLHKYLLYENAALQTDDESEAGPLEAVRAEVFRVLVLYTRKYEEEFRPHVAQFIGTSWNLLTTIGPESKYDSVVSRALEFLTVIASIREHAESFNNLDVLGQVTERVVIPNLSLRESDIETFEDEPIEFIRRNLEGSDDDTRRHAATKFLRKLMEQFEQPVTEVVMRYINHFLAEYAKDREENWKHKDTAIHLYFSIAAKGALTAAKGVLSVNPLVNVIDFFQTHVAEDLVGGDAQPLLKVDAIKYLHDYRSILSAQQWQIAFPLLVQHLNSSNYVVYTYAAIAVEQALVLTDSNGQPVIPRDSIVPLARDLLQHLFTLITRDTKPEKVQENEFLIKCVMRVLIVIRDGVIPIIDMVITNLVNITKVIRHNPSNPTFCYYHFESLGALIRFAGPTQSEKVEAGLFMPSMEVLQSQSEEFEPYIFQLYALMVSVNPTRTLSSNFQALVPLVTNIQAWSSKGKIPALTRLLIALIPAGSEQMASSNQIEPTLVIFRQLIASKAYETYAMELIETVVTSFTPAALENFWVPIFDHIFRRLSDSKTENLTLRFVRFYHIMSARLNHGLGADFFISISDRVRPNENLFTPIYTTIILPYTQKLSRPVDRKTACISLTLTLSDSQAFVDRYAKRGWTITCQALLQLLINPPLPLTANDNIIEDRDDLSFGAAFTPLNTCKQSPPDPSPEVQDVKTWVGRTLTEADQRHSGRIGRFVAEKLDDQGRAALLQVMNS